MNALVINCSPVRTRATAEVVSIVSKKLPYKYNVKSVCIDDYNFKFCKGCRSCHTTAKCIQNDDVGLLMNEFEFDGECYNMGKAFMCSLCHNGVLGGGLYLDSTSITYRTQKLTVENKYRNLVLPLNEIKEIAWKWVIFPVATFYMADGEQYKFIIFNKRRFEKWYQEMMNSQTM